MITGLNMTTMHTFFGNDAHLSEEAHALYADAIRENKIHLLPEAILEHVEDCATCKSEIIEALSLVEESFPGVAEPHPVLNAKVRQRAARFSFSYRIAATLLVGISVGVIFYLLRSATDRATRMSDSTVSAKIEKPTIQRSPVGTDKTTNGEGSLCR